jgi:hypothetical protein
MNGAMIVVMVVMMGGMAWGVVAAIRSRIRGKRDKKPD